MYADFSIVTIMTHILLLCGGSGTEHEVSLVSSKYISQQLSELNTFQITHLEIKEGAWYHIDSGIKYELRSDKSLLCDGVDAGHVDYVIPCIHGYPGETGDIQSMLDMFGIPYLGCNAESSTNSFNKITSKLWYDALSIPNTPYLFLSDNNEEAHSSALAAFKEWGGLFVKAACQGSSVGCYKVTSESELSQAINDAFGYSEQVLVEKAVKPRELEVAAYQIDGELFTTPPGEVTAPDGVFYTYDEKYGSDSLSTTTLTAENLSNEQIDLINQYSRKVFTQMKLKDLSRIDFFLTDDNEIFLNEVNTFPGMTPISMFPKLLEHNGDCFKTFLQKAILNALK